MTFNARTALRLGALALAGSALMAVATVRAADTAPGQHPERGQHMATVEQHYGAPATRYPAVGVPAITRWDYPTMVVYFENDLVLHTVLLNPGT
jgi:hypothetical protein